MLWTGLPWPSVRYQGGRLVLSEPHESDDPVGCGRSSPRNRRGPSPLLRRNWGGFAERPERALAALGVEERRGEIARRLAGMKP